ncbi:CCR4-NOT transcription complex subunit 3 [Trypanosoma theileri]|uniref:CCR4-NOT transcription complex subunit 3 n=1 Tax=Trypanosoma theileri TaxID=67003 RepID=A0A1X0NYF1_9TRYP|nr:CCR4-NOT transcription complex subunit 3 [Trypanosoma theileri]ORC89631.1 CCR4-NOT transcription complex subunit 3 [Trypanosoma theileri]
MANSKKTQQEIDRLVRRAQDGVESFDDLYDKYLKAGSQTLKERFEGELKREIKKVQRFRENIKVFISNPEVKDTKMLETSLKSIEERMELFKTCERETKTKAFSKEGLAAGSPNETLQAQRETSLKSTMEDMRKQIDILEYDLERDARGHNSGRTTKGTPSAVLARMRKLKFHLDKLELVLKAVTNGSADLDRVRDIEGTMQRLLQNETNSDEEDEDEDEEEENLYSGFDLEDSRTQEKRRSGGGGGADEDSAILSGSAQDLGKKTPGSGSIPTASTSAITSTSAKKTTPPTTVSKSDSVKRLSTTQPSPKTQTPGGGNTSISSTSGGKPISSRDMQMDMWDENEDLLDDEMDKANADTFGDDAMELTGTGSLADMAKATATLPRMGDWEKGRPASLASPPSTTMKTQTNEQTVQPPVSAATTAATTTTTTQAVKAANTTTTTITATAGATPTANTAAVSPRTTKSMATTPPAATATASQRASEQKQQTTANSSSTAVAGATNTTTASSNQTAISYDKNIMLDLVDMSLANLPHTQDVDRQRPFEPSNPTVCPSYYPQQVLPALASPDIYREFELETLFFIFYYHQNTYQQYYAAKQIKSKSFRYHKGLNTWFQRSGTLKETQGDGERGSFLFFNYEDTWRMEEKEDFTFNYKYLEDELR